MTPVATITSLNWSSTVLEMTKVAKNKNPSHEATLSAATMTSLRGPSISISGSWLPGGDVFALVCQLRWFICTLTLSQRSCNSNKPPARTRYMIADIHLKQLNVFILPFEWRIMTLEKHLGHIQLTLYANVSHVSRADDNWRSHATSIHLTFFFF